jgi:hypothetical protein
LTIQTLGAYTLNEIALAYDSASMSIYDPWISCVGYQCNAAGWAVGSGGGIDFYGGNQGVFSPIASRPNVIQGGWVS